MADVLMERNGVRADVAETSVAVMEAQGWAVVPAAGHTAPPAPVSAPEATAEPRMPPVRLEPFMARRKGRR